MEKSIVRDLLKGYLKGNGFYSFGESPIRDLSTLDHYMLGNSFTRLIEIIFELELEIGELLEIAEEVRLEERGETGVSA